MLYSYLAILLQKNFVQGLEAQESGEHVEIYGFIGFIKFNRWILRVLYSRGHLSSPTHIYEMFGIQYQRLYYPWPVYLTL